MTPSSCTLLVAFAFACLCGPANAQEQGWADVDGARLYYERSGTGPDVVLIHGLSLDRRMWQPQIVALAKEFRVTRYDVRGFGRSSAVASPHDPVADLLGLMDQLGIRRAHLVGMSMGGQIATDFVLAHPDRISTLVLVGAAIGGAPAPTVVGRLRAVFQLAADSGLPAAKGLWLRDRLLTPVRDTGVRRLVRSIVLECTCPQLGNPELFPRQAAPPAFGRLEQVRVPTLAITGEADDPDLIAIADTVERRVPNARRVRIQNAGHLVTLEQPAVVNAALLSFFSRHQ